MVQLGLSRRQWEQEKYEKKTQNLIVGVGYRYTVEGRGGLRDAEDVFWVEEPPTPAH